MQKVMGQTGRTVLSDDTIQYKVAQKRTIRYRYVKMTVGYRAEVVGPFHSRTYGVCSFGTKKTSAKNALKLRLANDYGYLGVMLFSDVDTADNVGDPDPRLLDANATARRLTFSDLCGTAGQ